MHRIFSPQRVLSEDFRAIRGDVFKMALDHSAHFSPRLLRQQRGQSLVAAVESSVMAGQISHLHRRQHECTRSEHSRPWIEILKLLRCTNEL